jgi:hypothetical protein
MDLSSWNISHLTDHEIVTAECFVLAGTEELSLEICRIELFDDENAVAAFQIPSLDPDGMYIWSFLAFQSLGHRVELGQPGAVFVGTFPYQDLGYRVADHDILSQTSTREYLIQKDVEKRRSSQVCTARQVLSPFPFSTLYFLLLLFFLYKCQGPN